MIRYAHPAGRPPGVQRAMRFCPAYVGRMKDELSQSLTNQVLTMLAVIIANIVRWNVRLVSAESASCCLPFK